MSATSPKVKKGSYDIVIIGAGVIGLSIALELVQKIKGIRPIIIARDIPEDVFSTGWASPWAGCNWHTFESDGTSPAANYDRVTYIRLGRLAQEHPELCERIPFYDVFSKRVPADKSWHRQLVGGIDEVVGSSTKPLPGNYPHAHKWKSYVINAPAYTLHLANLARSAGIPILQRRLSSLDEAYNLPDIGSVNLVVNGTGLGAKSLVGVEDELVYPGRGQTVLVRAPGVKVCVMQTEGFMAHPPEEGEVAPPKPAYIIPRPGPEGHVVLGGTYIPHDHSALPDVSEARRIIQDCYHLVPALAGPDGKSWEDVQVVAHNVGLRPAREGGPKVALEERELGRGGVGPMVEKEERGRKVGVVHAYGFGSAGFQASLGAAEAVVDLVIKYRAKHTNKVRSKL